MVSSSIALCNGSACHGVQEVGWDGGTCAPTGGGCSQRESMSKSYRSLRRSRGEESLHGLHVSQRIWDNLELEERLVVGAWSSGWLAHVE